MKNILRLFLLVAFVFIGSKVIFSDLDTSNSETKTVAVVNE